MTMSRLAELLDVSLPNVTGIVDRMEERGLVERGRDADDRRLVTVSVDRCGRATVEEIDQIRRQAAGQRPRAADPRAAAASAADLHRPAHRGRDRRRCLPTSPHES